MSPAYEANGQPVSPEEFYALACDPGRSVAVEACAGAGKTWMLVARIVRILLQQALDSALAAEQTGTMAPLQPQDILAITFTRKAAGEMRERLLKELDSFARLDRPSLRVKLLERGLSVELLDQMPLQSASSLESLLSNLYEALLASGRQVQIRTFHGWFAALLRNAPLAVLQTLQLPPSYELLEDDKRATALVWQPFYAALQSNEQALADYRALVADHGRHQAHKALEAIIPRRAEFALADAHGVVNASVPPFGVTFPAFAGLPVPDDWLGARPEHQQALRDAARVLGRSGNKPALAAGEKLEAAVTAQDWQLAVEALFTQKDEPRKFSAAIDGIVHVGFAQDLLQSVLEARAQHAAWEHQRRMARLARVLLAEFAALKYGRGWVDMADLERAAREMLANDAAGAWVQQRLDAQVRHLLIDEFQDTNPMQWQALASWLQSYAGAGGGGRPGVFIVGDPKQSIYRFRRAEPQVFRAAQDFVAHPDALAGSRLACDHTRRNAPAVLAAVNAAMAVAMVPSSGDTQQGQTGMPAFRPHTTGAPAEFGQGDVLCLPQIARPAAVAKPPRESWRDSLTTPREEAEDSLRAIEARQAARWIAAQIAAGEKPATFMVLARKRASLGVMRDELRALHVPAAVAEKAALADCCEVQDVVALLDALASPRHSLSLARALKSPLFGLSDDDLVAIALAARAVKVGLPEGTGEPGWLAVLQKTEHLPKHLCGLHAVLTQYQTWARTLPPHDALSAILHHADALRRFAVAAPPAERASVVANLGALLQATLALDGARYTTAYGFVRALKAGTVQAPAQIPAEAVQLLTVHGAKGLEAPTVLLLDTDAQASSAESMGVLVDWPGESPYPRQLVFMVSEGRPCASVADALTSEREARAREEVNGLYVAMTRAKSRLVVSSSKAHRPDPQSWWERLVPLATPVRVPEEPGVLPPAAPKRDEFSFSMPSLPCFEPAVGAKPSFDAIKSVADAKLPDVVDATARIGLAMHRLLEWQPTLPGPGSFKATPAQRAAVAREFQLAPAELARAEALAQRIREGPARWAWDALILAWEANEVELAWQGKILRLDRLVRRADTGEWWVLDYKSAVAPDLQAGLAQQLHDYRAAVQALYPGDVVRGAFLAGDGSLIAL